MILCVAEKPSAGRDIAKVLGANTRHDGYMEGNGYWVTWTFGHLCALYDPQEYNEQWKGWNMSALPMIPERFSIKVSGDDGVKKQFNIIRGLMSQATEVINCGDPGQEGELIQRWVYQQAGCKVPVKRLWTSSLTEEAIREAFQQLKDQSAYQHLYEAGLMRAIGDWLLGMNASRAYTLKYARGVGKDRQILSIGRVQTPTLALIVKRQQEIEHFVPRTYYELKTIYRDTLFSYVTASDQQSAASNQQSVDKQDDSGNSDSSDLKGFATIEEAQAVIDSIKDQPLTITSVEKKKSTEYAPRLFDLTSLQVECNKSFGYTADQTLKLIQSLYEKHVTTYPRVDTTYLSEDIYAHVPKTLQGIKDYFPETQPLLTLKADGKKGPDSLPKSKKVFDNKKVTDHHAIIPTGQRPDNLTEQERKVFNKIALRFIAAFYPDCQVSNTTVLAEVVGQQSAVSSQQSSTCQFKVTGRQVLIPGWREVFSKNAANQEQTADEQPVVTLPDFVKGESGPHEPQLKEKTTTPPKYYTEATLLRAMETAGKTVEDEDLRDAMKENGIGRPSTRAAIIEKLFQRRYIERQGKTIHATPVGIDLIAKIISPLLMSAELTGRWEKKMRMIERGEYEAREFLGELKQMTIEVVREVKADQTGTTCPLCKQGRIIRGRTRYGCSRWREGCTYAAPFA